MSSLKSILLDETLPAELRMRSMNALQNMPTRTVAATLRKLLGDPMDELRLIAYGMLDAKEKGISASIQAEREGLKRIDAPGARLNALRHLGELNWELVYSGLVQGDVRAYTLEQALRHVEAALELAERDPGLWFLKARVLQTCHRVAESREGFSMAISCGLPEERALPYLAEIAFEQRDFAALRKYIGIIADTQSTPAMGPIIRFWRGSAPSVLSCNNFPKAFELRVNFERRADSADVALLLEGTYPFVSGGVSSWVHQIIRSFPDIRFALYFIGSRRQDYGESKYRCPPTWCTPKRTICTSARNCRRSNRCRAIRSCSSWSASCTITSARRAPTRATRTCSDSCRTN